MEEEAARPATNRMGAWREATVAAAEGMDRLHRALADAALGGQKFKETTEQTTRAFREEIQAATTLAGAVKENEMAEMEAAQEAGLISQEEYATQRLEIEMRYLAKKRELQEREEMTEILILRRQGELAEMRQPELTAAAESGQLKKAKALEDLGSLDKEGINERKKSTAAALEEWERKLKTPELIEQFAAIGTGKTQLDAERWMQSNASKTGYYNTSGSNYYMQWDALKRGATGAESEWKQLPGAEAQRKVAADRASEEAERAMKKAVENQSFITETGRDVADRRSRFDTRHQANRETLGLEQDTLSRRAEAAAMKSPTGKLVSAVAESERILQLGGRISVHQQGEIRTVIEMLNRAHVAQGEVVLKGLGSLHGDVDVITKKLAAVVHKIDQQGKQLRNQASPQ